MNYEQMSDSEISQKVGELISRDGLSVIGANGKACIHHYSAPVGEFGEMCMGWKEFDPCNSWGDAGPIIVSNKISLHAPSLLDSWSAEFVGSDDDVNDGYEVDYFQHRNINPLRAAMIVFLMMHKND